MSNQPSFDDQSRQNARFTNEELGFSLLFWAMRDAAILGEAGSGQMMLWTPAATALLGYDATEVVGPSIELLVPEAWRECHHVGIARYAVTWRGAPARNGPERGTLEQAVRHGTSIGALARSVPRPRRCRVSATVRIPIAGGSLLRLVSPLLHETLAHGAK